MGTLYDLNLFLYNLSIFPVIFFSVVMVFLVVLNFLSTKEQSAFTPIKKRKSLPFVSVQIPVFNDPIAVRCVEKCLKFDYPKNKYEVIIADDSTDLTTQKLLKSLEKKYPSRVKYVHRKDRTGFKPGALQNSMKFVRGEIVVIFDADFIPQKDFLRKIVVPFEDERVAIVQARPSFYNEHTNLITKFATQMMMIYHTIIMPINNKFNSVLFGGSAGAIRKKALEEVGGWNLGSITEDSDLSLRILLAGYKSVYLSFETPSEVPDTLESFVKQQMRWCYGNSRVFLDNIRALIFDSTLSLRQRIMISYVTFGNLIGIFVVFMTLFGTLGWFLGEPSLLTLGAFLRFIKTFIFTSGFMFLGFVTLLKNGRVRDFPTFFVASWTIGMVVIVFNSIALLRAAFRKSSGWYCTPKVANEKIGVKL